VYILLKSGIHAWYQVAGTAISLVSLIKGTSEAVLFSLSGGKRIPKPTAVLLGMVPLAIDVTMRVLGQAFVIVFAPIVGVISVCAKFLITSIMSCFLVGQLGESETFKFSNLKSARMNSLVPYSKTADMQKSRLKKYFAINRIVISTILLIEISTILALTSEVDKQVLDCTSICPVAVNETVDRNLTLTENFTPFEKLTHLRTDGDGVAKACRAHVEISQSGCFTLAVVLLVMVLYTTIESSLMLCTIYEKCEITTLSDRLLFDQGDLPDKVADSFNCCLPRGANKPT